MPNCKNCNHKWSFFDAMKIGFTNSRACPNCGERQYVLTKSRRETYIIYPIFLIFILFSRPLFDWLGLSSVMFYALAVVLVSSLIVYIPYTISLSDEQEPLW